MKASCSGCSSAALRQTFDGENLLAFRFHREDQAGVHRSSVHDDGTGAAVPFVASNLRAGELQFVPQHIEERLAGPGDHLVILVVDIQMNNPFHSFAPPSPDYS